MRFLASLFGVCRVVLAVNSVAQSGDPVSYEWDLTEIYSVLDDWEQAMVQLDQRIQELPAYAGTLGGSAQTLLQALSAISDSNKEAARAYV